MRARAFLSLAILLGFSIIGAPLAPDSRAAPKTDPDVTITITNAKNVPSELNPNGGGARRATFKQAAAFAWQEFIALNWPADTQSGQKGQRDKPHTSAFCPFGTPSAPCQGPLVWETMRSKVETFPGNHQPPPGYASGAGNDYGYDALPQYNYSDGAVSGPCVGQIDEPAPWINLDETDQITLNNMYAGVVRENAGNNSQPKLIRFLAKSNRTQYLYVAKNGWWDVIQNDVTQATRNYLAQHMASPPPETPGMVSQPFGTVEVKAGWRPLNPDEAASGRFHMQKVRYYEQGSTKFSRCWRDAEWGLVSLHIIQKTPSAPYFIYATFEQADNILTPAGGRVEDEDGNINSPRPTTATSPQVCLNDLRPQGGGAYPSKSGQVVTTTDPANCQTAPPAASYCTAPGRQIYYHNVAPRPATSTNSEPSGGDICVNQRVNAIPQDIITENRLAHNAMRDYGFVPATTPWFAYKLVNVQYYPYDKVIATQTPNGSLYNYQGPNYDADHPTPASYYLANILVETNRSLQQFSGGLSPQIATDWDANGDGHKNTYYNGTYYNMGGCMGCHGSQGQNPTTNPGGDFSVILSRGAVITPEIPAIETTSGVQDTSRNRQLSQ